MRVKLPENIKQRKVILPAVVLAAGLIGASAFALQDGGVNYSSQPEQGTGLVEPAAQSSQAESESQAKVNSPSGNSASIGNSETYPAGPSSEPSAPAAGGSAPSNGGESQQSPPQAEPVTLISQEVVYRDDPNDPAVENGYCVKHWSDGSTTESWVGKRPKANSHRYQHSCN